MIIDEGSGYCETHGVLYSVCPECFAGELRARAEKAEAELAELRRLAEPLAEYWQDRRCVDEDGDECDCDDCFLDDNCPLQDFRARYQEETK